LRLTLAALGVGALIIALVLDGDAAGRLVCIALAVLFSGMFTLVLVTDIRLRRWRSPLGNQRHHDVDPAGRPTATEWAFAAVFDTSCVLMLCAGVLDAQTGSGELLIGGVTSTVVALGCTAGTVGRWRKSRVSTPSD
jgi:hypothetical protein